MSQPPAVPSEGYSNNVVHIDRYLIDRAQYERDILQRQIPQMHFGPSVEEEYVERTKQNLERLKHVGEFVTITLVFDPDEHLDSFRPDLPTPPDYPPSEKGM